MNKHILLAAGLVAGVAAVAAIGYGIFRSDKTGTTDEAVAKVESTTPQYVAAVDVTYNAKGEPVAARPVVLTTDNQVVGYAEPHPLSQINEAHTFVKGVPAEEHFLGGVTTSRLLIGQFTCFDRGGIRMVRLDSKADGFRKELIFVANDDCRTRMVFENGLKAATTDQPQFVQYRDIGAEISRAFSPRRYVNYNLDCISDRVVWTDHRPWDNFAIIKGPGTDAVLSQAVMVGWNAGCTGGASSGGGWQVQCGVGWSSGK